MTYSDFTKAEKSGWHDRAAAYGSYTARATLQIVPAMLSALRLRPGIQLLDTACGPGYVAGAAAALDVHAQGIDYAPGMIDAAQKRFPGLTFSVADAEDLPFPDRSFDAVACNMGLFHMGDPDKAMHEAARVLRTGGRFSFSQWTAPSDSALYQKLFAALSALADLSRADQAPDAYHLSDAAQAQSALETAGFTNIEIERLETILFAADDDFFDFFLQFGVRVPLIVQAQDPQVRDALRLRINADMQPYKTETGYAVPMPSLLYTGVKP